MLNSLFRIHYVALLAVIGSLSGSVLMREVLLLEERFRVADFFVPISIVAIALALKLIKFD